MTRMCCQWVHTVVTTAYKHLARMNQILTSTPTLMNSIAHRTQTGSLAWCTQLQARGIALTALCDAACSFPQPRSSFPTPPWADCSEYTLYRSHAAALVERTNTAALPTRALAMQTMIAGGAVQCFLAPNEATPPTRKSTVYTVHCTAT